MAAAYPDILITLHDNWRQAASPFGGGGAGGLSFPELYLNYFAMMFLSENEPRASAQEDRAETPESLMMQCDEAQRAQLEELRSFCLSLTGSCCSKFISPEDVYDWLNDFLRAATQETVERFRTKSALVNEIRKYYSRKRNPGGYEFTGKLRDALRELASTGRIEVRSLASDRYIRKDTSFKTKSAPDRNAMMEDYEAKRETIPHYRTRIRGGGVEHAGIITPKDAAELAMKLLEAFNGWARFADLVDAAWNHVPKTLLLVREDDSVEQGDTSSDPAKAAAESLDGIILSVSAEKSETIWCEIRSVTREDFFCLYILPEKVGAGKRKLEDFGPPGTMSEQNKKVWTILTKELRYITVRHGKNVDLDSLGPSGEPLHVEDAEKVAREVFRNLNGKCTDHGYDTGVNLNV